MPVSWQLIRISRRSSRRSSRKFVSVALPIGGFITCAYSSPSSKRSPLTSITRGHHSG